MATATDHLAAEQSRQAARRVRKRTAERTAHIETLDRDGIDEADTPQRVAMRAHRLGRYYAAELAPTVPLDTVANAAPGTILERIMGTNDLVGVRYLEAGAIASRAVGRVQIDDSPGHLEGYGTASMVSSSLLLTNHHVLPSSDVAAASAIEFNFQIGLDGRDAAPATFPLDPDTFFVNDEALDFALVAVGGDATARAGFGWNPLIEAEGKVVIGEFVTIVQHPGGGLKQIAIRDNRLVDVLDTFLHYEADTEPGSSGSPVFNDQWEIVALHHASVPTDGDRPGFVNEGIRVSRLLAFIRQAGLPPGMQRLRNELFGPERTEIPQRVDVRGRRVPGRTAPLSDSTVVASRSRGWRRPEPARPPASATLTVPLEITVSLGRGTAVDLARDAVAEAVTIDPDYASREGYDGTFLGATDDLLVDLPKLSPAMRARVATIPDERGEGGYVLRYHHYSVVMNRDRRLAYFTAVNIDGTQSRQPKRESDRWFIDPRIPEDDQTGEAVYADNDLDRGHLVRRLDPAWGSDEQAKVANDDTFHFTNCTPQHRDFNQNRTTWAGLENYILENADNRDLRVCVFTGPVLADDDDLYRGVQLPRQFWKVVTMVKRDGTLSATGYLLSQEDLLKGLELDPDFSYGAYRTFQVPISHIEALTGLSIGVAEHDPLLADEAEAATFREIGSREDIVL